ncbi:hypothetical protein F4604DRAFT_1927099 [Suillus subluteus]|nr:hypothetical protein F4604DRAFT_1927099 [Suillus subluteus]
MLPPPLNYSLNLELLLSLAFPLGPSLMVPPPWFLLLHGPSSLVVPPPWFLLGSSFADPPSWTLLPGPSFLDPPSWILLCGPYFVDPPSWTLLCGPSFVDPPLWTLLPLILVFCLL